MSLLLEVKNFSTSIEQNGKPLFQSFSLHLNSKERMILSGPSGSGKSVLLRSLVFLDPIKEGEIYFKGKLVSPHDIPFFRSQVIYFSQKPSLFEGTVEDNLKRAFDFKKNQEKKYSRERVLKLLESFNLGEKFLNQRAKLLSGGESQIVALIRALYLEPTILLLDEPTASLDPSKINSFESLVLNWVNTAQDQAFVWVTHQREQEARLGTRSLTLGH